MQDAIAQADRGRSYHLVDPELRAMLDLLPRFRIDAEGLAAARQAPSMPPLSPPAPQPEYRRIPGAPGDPDVEIMLIDPAPGASGRPALLHMHAGGYIIGKPERFARLLQLYASETGCVIASVRYRLAPETPFPGALEDNYAALSWLHAEAATLGIDPARIAVGGDSAGGGHAAMLAIAARDRGGPPIAFQFLIYPMLDDRTGDAGPVSPFVGEYVWRADDNRFAWRAYLGDMVPAGAVPARARDLGGLPPAFIACGALDLFVEENLAYAARLIAAGVPVDLHVEAGAFHGFNIAFPDTVISRRFNARIVAGLRDGLDHAAPRSAAR